MYDELVKRLRESKNEQCYIGCFGNCGDCKIDAELEQAADAIEELQGKHFMMKKTAEWLAEKVPKWIPVTERLPDCFDGEEIGNVEWISHGTVYAGCFGRGGKWRDAYFRTWNDDTEGIDAYDAECWRIVTLPEPPKEET